MIKHEFNADLDMLFSGGKWHFDIILPVNAEISEIHMRVYSFSHPEKTFAVSWGEIRRLRDELQIPVDARRPGTDESDSVRLAFDITYYRNLDD